MNYGIGMMLTRSMAEKVRKGMNESFGVRRIMNYTTTRWRSERRVSFRTERISGTETRRKNRTPRRKMAQQEEEGHQEEAIVQDKEDSEPDQK
jgi:hypothetical protein